ncbi:MAG: DUF447 family protein [Clostridia bacterium]|nr:DUF447 family protein [Clostridia bacterium]
MKRKSVGTHFSSCVQPAFIIGTKNEDGSNNFAPITWVSATCEKGNDYWLVISMFGKKRTKENVLRTGKFSANLVTTALLPLMDYLGTHSSMKQKKDALPFAAGLGAVLDVPILENSPWIYECEVGKTAEVGESTTFFCRIRNVQIDETLTCADPFDVDLTKIDPVVYSGMYHSIGKRLGKIGDFTEAE